MRDVAEGNAGDLLGLVPPGVLDDGDAVEDLNARTLAELGRQGPLLEARRRAERVRPCHGDLHLANITLLDGAPVLFDCLEFDEALACTDTLYDLAFLVTGLLGRGLPEEARALLQVYADLAGDEETPSLALLPLLVSVRAAVRAKVSGLNAAVLEGEEREGKVTAARAYLDLARGGLGARCRRGSSAASRRAPATLEARVAARHGDVSDADTEVVHAQVRRVDAAVTWPRVVAGRPVAEVVAEVRASWEG